MPKYYSQHPFQEKVVIEVFNRQNMKYPSEMISNYFKWINIFNDMQEDDRFIWARESSQPVVNSILVTQDVISIFQQHYEKNGLHSVDNFYEFLKNLQKAESEKGFLLFFQIYDQFLRTPTTAIVIVTIEIPTQNQTSNLFYITEHYKKRQDDLHEILKALGKNEILTNSGDGRDLTYLWQGINDINEHSFSNPMSWINLGVLGVVAKELKCCFALLRIIKHYLSHENRKVYHEVNDFKHLETSADAIFHYLINSYLKWFEVAIKTLEIKGKEVQNIKQDNNYLRKMFHEYNKYISSIKNILSSPFDHYGLQKNSAWNNIVNILNRY